MAKSSCYLIVNSLIAKTSSSVIDEASIDIGVYDDLQAFKQSLLPIRDWYWKVDFEQEHLYSTHFCVREMKHFLYDAENVVDEFECERLRKEVFSARVNSRTKVARFFSTSNPFVFQLRMAKQIKELNKRLCGYKLQNSCSEVASLWAVLGLLPSPNKDETLIDVANRCLLELMWRFFLQNFFNFGSSFYFQIHDSANDLARSISKYECHIVSSNIQNVPENVQHVSFAEDDLLGNSFTSKSIVVRTMLFPIEGVGASSVAFLNMCVSRYRYLRILDLSDSTYETLPWSIGKLRHLRFLSLERNEKIKRIPYSICKLHNLEVLNLVGCTKLEILPKRLRNLISLRQLRIPQRKLFYLRMTLPT
ncbi:unnamed protein product [Lupinus luteus]|uniref:Uncharacterized protein n=1 Tax=Lupinus luteus TaxID=3873 RepID=A0AAV1WGZ6_LUPLU